jgi:hypothetical protein
MVQEKKSFRRPNGITKNAVKIGVHVFVCVVMELIYLHVAWKNLRFSPVETS